MKPLLPLFVMIDAFGWEILQQHPFGAGFVPFRKQIDSILGYSSACVPTILSGRWPDQHRNWCYFVYDPERSPFKQLRCLRWLPEAISSRRIFRRWLARCLKAPLKFRGYFDLYNIPFQHIHLFDFTEKKNPLEPRGLNRGPNIFDHLQERNIPFYVSDPGRTEQQNFEALSARIESEQIDFAFLYWPGLDGILHMRGNAAPEIGVQLRKYEIWLQQLLAKARQHYSDTHLYVFSDHGMANCVETLDLQALIRTLPVAMPRDYAVVYDSTMARFWFFNRNARDQIVQRLRQVPQGRILSDAELVQLHTLFPDRYFGELMFLVKEGVLIVPSYMGQRPIQAMHGYHPSEPQSVAALLSNRPEPSDQIKGLTDLFGLMTEEAALANLLNRSRPSPAPTGARAPRSVPAYE